MNREQDKPQQETRKIHPTHFPVVKIPLRDSGQDNGFEWIDMGNGQQIRVPKKIVIGKVFQNDDKINI